MERTETSHRWGPVWGSSRRHAEVLFCCSALGKAGIVQMKKGICLMVHDTVRVLAQPLSKNKEPEPNVKRERHQPVECYLDYYI